MTAGFDIRPVTGRIGAEILGVDLAAELAHETVAAVRAALVRHKVIFFRNQRLDAKAQVTFAKRFGPCAGAGVKATSRSGTTAPPSTMPWPTTAASRATCSV
jgi:alpha-ketoglutarate-dependent sulfate ester dioxygenase